MNEPNDPNLPSSERYPFPDPLKGWNILGPDFDPNDPLDFLSYEWEYFTVQDLEGQFVGAIGYVLANPRGQAESLLEIVPTGGNIAVAGQTPGREPVAEFLTFSRENTIVSAKEKFMQAEDPGSELFATLRPTAVGDEDSPALLLQGSSSAFEWELVVTQDFKERDALRESGEDPAFTPVRDDDVGRFPGEHWTVDAVWPRTRLSGSVKLRSIGETIPITAKGYRENSFGRYLFPLDGWDFAVFSDSCSGVMSMLQTYHRSTKLDYFDLSFLDQNQPVAIRFRTSRGELGWFHPTWTFRRDARQCCPLETVMVAQNQDYRVELEIEIGERMAPFLSEATLGTRKFFIMEQFPQLRGTIRRRDTGKVVTNFEGLAGGEFALRKSFFPLIPSFFCNWVFKNRFSAPLP